MGFDLKKSQVKGVAVNNGAHLFIIQVVQSKHPFIGSNILEVYSIEIGPIIILIVWLKMWLTTCLTKWSMLQ